MAKVIVCSNQKGGVSKTLTAGAVATGLGARGYKVLAVDCDPQGNLSDNEGAQSEVETTVYEVLKNKFPVRDAIQHLSHIDVLPSNILLAGIEQELTSTGKEYRLKEALTTVQNDYDYIVIDTPPSLGVLTINALVAADDVIIPATQGKSPLKGITQLNDTITAVQKYCNASVKIAGILLTRFNERSSTHNAFCEVAHQIATVIGTKVYDTHIRNAVVVEDAQAAQQDILLYKPQSTVAQDYDMFINEYLKEGK